MWGNLRECPALAVLFLDQVEKVLAINTSANTDRYGEMPLTSRGVRRAMNDSSRVL